MFRRIRENLGWAIAGFTIAIPMAWAAAVIFSGDEVKALKENLSLNDVIKWRSSAGDPEGAVTAPVGSLHSNTASGALHRKKTGTGNTGWSQLGLGGGGVYINQLSGFNPDFEDDVSLWTEVTTPPAHETTASEVGFEGGSLSWTPAGADTLSSSQVTLDTGLYTNSCLARAWIKGGGTNLSMQVYDGTNVLAETALQAYAEYTEVRIPFVCPDSGTVGIRINASGAESIMRMDEVYIGENFNIGTITSGGEVVAVQRSPSVTGCQWTSTGTWADLGPIAACGANVAEYEAPGYDIDETDRNEIYLKMNNLKVGKYLAVFRYGNHWRNAVPPGFGHCSIRTTVDGVNFSTVNSVELEDDHSMAGTVQLFYDNTTEQDVTFKVQDAAEGGSCVLFNQAQSGSQGVEAGWTLHRLGPSPQETVIFPEAQGFLIDVGIGGSNLGFGGAPSPYAVIGSSALSMVVNHGEKWDPEITCAGTEEASGLICSGSEQVGIEFTAPVAGKYEVCMDFGVNHYCTACTSASCGNQCRTTLQLNETPLNAQTQGQSGGSKLGFEASAPQHFPTTNPFGGGEKSSGASRLCGVFKFDSAGRKAVRLWRRVGAGGVTNGAQHGATIYADRNATYGDRQIHATVKMLNPFLNPPTFADQYESDVHPNAALVNASPGYSTIHTVTIDSEAGKPVLLGVNPHENGTTPSGSYCSAPTNNSCSMSYRILRDGTPIGTMYDIYQQVDGVAQGAEGQRGFPGLMMIDFNATGGSVTYTLQHSRGTSTGQSQYLRFYAVQLK